MNHRQILNGVLERLGLLDRSSDVLRSIDKLSKIGRDKVVMEMVDNRVASSEQAGEILRIADLSGSADDVLAAAQELVAGSERGEEGIGRLRATVDGATAGGVPANRITVDASIARGLDYYTGTIVETFLDQLPEIGSVCSGGRYDDLAGTYSKQQLPGVGASLGLDRLLAALEELSVLSDAATPAPVLVTFFDKTKLHDYLALAKHLRSAGIGVEVYPDSKKLGQQLKFADRRGFRLAIIAGDEELQRGQCQIKDLTTGQSLEASLDNNASDVVSKTKELLAS